MKKITLGAMMTIILVLYFILSPVAAQKLKTYKGDSTFAWVSPVPDKTKRTIFIIADNNGTEMFDLAAPFYLFNATEKANVYIVSEKKAPVLLVNSLYILPHFTFSEIDSLRFIPDVIVIPNITVHLKEPPKASVVNWIRNKVTSSTIVLSICDGSATAAATGLYDGKPITTHATDYKTLKKQFPKPMWVKDVSVTESGNLYSTAGVSNAVEGSLTVIKRLFGEKTAHHVIENIKYPHDSIQLSHNSEVVGTGSVMRIASKVLFKKNYKIGVWLNDNVNEFELASLLDTYARTFPASLNTFSAGGKKVTSKYGLTMYPTGDAKTDVVNEFHLLEPRELKRVDEVITSKVNVINYGSPADRYPFDFYLERIGVVYGEKFSKCVRLTLDYN